MIVLCQASNIHMLNGRINKDTYGLFTRTGTTGCGVVDNVLVDPYIANIATYFQAEHPLLESDHCPITTLLGVTFQTESKRSDSGYYI